MNLSLAKPYGDRPQLNPELARQFFETLYSPYLKGATRPTYIEVRGKLEADKDITFRRFYLSIDLLIKDMGQWPTGRHYWFGVALRWSDTKGTKNECLALTTLFTDVDYGKAGHKKKNRWQTREEAQGALDDFPIIPSIIVHSGGGFQVYWILSKPFGIENGNHAQVEATMKGIGAAIGGDDGTQDVSRILRIPGTFNIKTDEPRPVEMISCDPGLVYDLADFAHYAAQVPDPPLKAAPQDGPQTTNLDELKAPAWAKGLILTGDISGYDDDRSKRDHAVIGALKKRAAAWLPSRQFFRSTPSATNTGRKAGRGENIFGQVLTRAPPPLWPSLTKTTL